MVTRCIMVYPCFQSLVMCGKVFKNNWNGFLYRKRYINQRQYDPLFKKFEFENYIFVADTFTYHNRRYLEDMFCFYGY